MLKKLNIIDAAIGSALLLSAIGIVLVQSGIQKTSGNMVNGESDIQITISAPSTEIADTSILKAGDDTALTVRNQPRGDVKVTKVYWTPQKMTLMSPSGRPVVVSNIAKPNVYDLTVTLRDHALVSKEGYVSNGVKIKVGQPIEIEGFAYRLSGKITGVAAATTTK